MADDQDDKPSGPPQFGYSGDAAGPAYEFWREEFCRRVMVVDLAPLNDGPVRCTITPAHLPQLGISCSTGTPIRFTSLGVNSDLVLVISPDSPLHVVMGERTLDVPPRGISLGDASMKGAYVSQLENGGFKTVLVDRKALLEQCPDAEDRIAQPIAQDPTLASLLHQYYDLVVQHATGLDALAQKAVSQHLIDLVVLALGVRRDEAEQAKSRGLAAARFEAIKADIVARLGDSGLSLGDIAKRHRASPRYVQVLFERAGTTFSEFVLEQRLLMAHRLLSSPLNSARKVSDIAHTAGFGDVSYFHRAFRKRFGATPSEVRADRRADS
ncbi:MAG: AraC family transcriptional regulator [Hyphomicrobium sp.]